MQRFSRRTGLLATGVVALLVAARLSPRAIPYNMDEFVHYQALGCLTAVHARDLPVIRDGCGYFDLRLPFSRTPLPLRSYSYIGSIPSLPFYPFWRLFDAPVASRVGGAAYFLLFALLARRLLRVRVGSVVTASLVFPVWLVTFLVDEGPVGFSAVLLLLALLAARRALHAPGAGARAAWAAAAGLGLFLGLWTKLVFAWWLPAFAVFVLEEARRLGLSFKALARAGSSALLAGVVGLLLPTAVLLASVDRDGRPYAAVLWQADLSAEAGRVEAVAMRLVHYVTDGSLVAPRNLTLPSWPVDILPLLLSVALLAAGWRWSRRRRELVTWVILSVLTFAFAASSGYSQWPHHFAFPLLLLVFALALCLDGLPARGRLAAAALAVVFWATLGARLPSTAFSVEASPDKDVLLAFVRGRGLDRQTLQVHASWGTYYLALLFGDRERMVVYVRRIVDDPAQLRKMAELARRVGRPLLLVSSRRWERIETPQVREVLGPPLHTWRFGDWWAIEHDPRVGEGVRSSSPPP